MTGSFKGSTAGPTGVCGVDWIGVGDRSKSTNKGQASGLNASVFQLSFNNSGGAV